jgi:transposase-like protein
MWDWTELKGGFLMSEKRSTSEEIINKLREVEIMLSKGSTVGEASKKIGVTEQTYYRWRKQYGGMRIEQAKRLKELGKENARLRKLVADLSLDISLLKEAARGNF